MYTMCSECLKCMHKLHITNYKSPQLFPKVQKVYLSFEIIQASFQHQLRLSRTSNDKSSGSASPKHSGCQEEPGPEIAIEA